MTSTGRRRTRGRRSANARVLMSRSHGDRVAWRPGERQASSSDGGNHRGDPAPRVARWLLLPWSLTKSWRFGGCRTASRVLGQLQRGRHSAPHQMRGPMSAMSTSSTVAVRFHPVRAASRHGGSPLGHACCGADGSTRGGRFDGCVQRFLASCYPHPRGSGGGAPRRAKVEPTLPVRLSDPRDARLAREPRDSQPSDLPRRSCRAQVNGRVGPIPDAGTQREPHRSPCSNRRVHGRAAGAEPQSAPARGEFVSSPQ